MISSFCIRGIKWQPLSVINVANKLNMILVNSHEDKDLIVQGCVHSFHVKNPEILCFSYFPDKTDIG
jgi:hypothetical protein